MRCSLTELAENLGLNSDTLERWIRQGKIPVNKQDGMAVYNQSELNRWIEKQSRGSAIYRIHHYTDNEPNRDRDNDERSADKNESFLLSALKKGGLFYDIAGTAKDEILEEIVKFIPDFPEKNSGQILYQLIEREKLASTGIGKGVAIPHPRNPIQGLNEPMILTCFLNNRVNFDSIDNKPVLIIFLILSPSVETHLNLLSRLSFCLRDNNFLSFIMQKPDKDSLFNKIREIESSIDFSV